MATTSIPGNPNSQTKLDETLAEIDRLRAENARMTAALVAKAQGKITVKRTKPDGKTKGNALSVYGLGRYPITLYREQAEALCRPEVIAEILAMAKTLPRKAQRPADVEPQEGF